MPRSALASGCHCASAPPIYRFKAGTCERCGRESCYLAKVAIRQPLTKHLDRAVLTCATCRERNAQRWVLAAGWHDGIAEPRDEPMEPGAWEAWVRENPPLDDAALVGYSQCGGIPHEKEIDET